MTIHAPRRLLCPADILYDGLGRPRPGSAALIQSEPAPARLIAVGATGVLREAHPEATPLPAAPVIAPAPVNAHTHLDLSTLPFVPGRGYVDFVRAVLTHGRAGRRNLAAAEVGLAELRAAGIDTIGDVVTDPAVMRHLLGDPNLRGVAYWEVIAPDPADADRVFDDTVALIEGMRRLERPGGVRVGLSPHAPHTVSAPLLARFAAYALRGGLPLQIHVAEHGAEVELHRTGGGELRAAFGEFLAPFAPSGRSPIGFLEGLGFLRARPTLVHAVHVDDDDLRVLQRAGCAVVHCPRSNAALGCGTFPWAAYARHGVTVALGTDSRASGGSLSVVDEYFAAAAVHGRTADPAQLVWAAVKGGHRALGSLPPKVTRGALAGALRRWVPGRGARDVAHAPV